MTHDVNEARRAAVQFLEQLVGGISDAEVELEDTDDELDMRRWGRMWACGTSGCLGGWLTTCPALREMGFRDCTEAHMGDGVPENVAHDLEPFFPLSDEAWLSDRWDSYIFLEDPEGDGDKGERWLSGFTALMCLFDLSEEGAEYIFGEDNDSSLEAGIRRMRLTFGMPTP